MSSWNAPRTWADDEYVTAAYLNRYLRDDLLETAPAKATAAGEIFYADAANSITPLSAAGDDNYLLGGRPGSPVWRPITGYINVDLGLDQTAFVLSQGFQDTLCQVDFNPGWGEFSVYGYALCTIDSAATEQNVQMRIHDESTNAISTAAQALTGVSLNDSVTLATSWVKTGYTDAVTWTVQARHQDPTITKPRSSFESAAMLAFAVRTS